MGKFSSYDIWGGLELVLLAYLVLVLVLLGVFSLQLYKYLRAQDSSLANGISPDVRSQVLNIVKRAILWVVGYKGEERERTPVDQVDLKWISTYRSSILLRFLPVYAAYILGLVVLTRPVFLDGDTYQIFRYSENLHELFFLLVIYVLSNIVFDYLSLRYSLSHVMQAQESKRYVFFFAKDMAVAFGLFLVSQAVSCILWVLKRQDLNFPELGFSLFDRFLEITFWPYAFVTGEGSTEIVSELFPGQLFITGTVFFPTVMLGAIFVAFSLFLKLARSIKTFLVSRQLDRICRLFLKVHIVGMFESETSGNKFRYCNLAFLALLNLTFVTGVGVVAGRLFSS